MIPYIQTKMQRKHFTFQGKECVSAGIIFYRSRKNGNGIELLFQRKADRHAWYEDLGGKAGPEDPTIEHVAAREASEESNGAFIGPFKYAINDLLPKNLVEEYDTHIKRCTQYILELMKHSLVIVNKKTKYALWCVQLPSETPIRFDNKEYNTQYYFYRSLEWVPYTKCVKMNHEQLHPRIRHFHRMLLKYDGAHKGSNRHLLHCRPQQFDGKEDRWLRLTQDL